MQQLFADVLIHYLEISYARFLEVHSGDALLNPEPPAISQFEESLGCVAATDDVFRLDTSQYVGQEPPLEVVEATGWCFKDDISGAPGLIGYGNSSRNLVTFDLPCEGNRSVIDIGFLASYEGMGAARVMVHGEDSAGLRNTSKVIESMWGARASEEIHRIISIPQHLETTRISFEVLSAEMEEEYSLRAEIAELRRDRKFKLMNIQCC